MIPLGICLKGAAEMQLPFAQESIPSLKNIVNFATIKILVIRIKVT